MLIVDEVGEVGGVPFEDGRLGLRDGRVLSWRRWRPADSEQAILWLQGSAGSRVSRGAASWAVTVLAADRPGFGRSTRLPGRGLRVVADDLVELFDAFGHDAVAVVARSGGAPHALALAAVAPDRVNSLSIISGACPILDEERAGLVGANARLGSVLPQGWDAVHAYLDGLRERLLSEGSARVLVDAPAEDRARMDRPDRQSSERAYRAEALRQGAEGWADETVAITGPWDFELSAVRVHVDWWHGANDRTVPLPAAQRLTAQLPDCTLYVVQGAHLLNIGSLPSPRTG